MTMEYKKAVPSQDNNLSISEKVAKCACSHYNCLSKNGKPLENQWTSMAALCLTHNSGDREKFEVISLGTGTKCLGQKDISATGDLLTDSHAEIIARRGFLCYLYDQLKLCLDGDSDNKSILKLKSSEKALKEVEVKEGIKFHLFISHAPCGDAAIFPVEIEKVNELEEESPPSKRSKVTCDPPATPNIEHQHRTGAKLQVGAKHFEEDFQEAGQVRVKGGKGDPTLCMSCSDKIFKWQLMGLQGSLLSNFVKEPIRLSSVVIGACVPYNYCALERAIFLRFYDKIVNLPACKQYPGFISGFVCPHIVQSNINFMEFTNAQKPAPGSIISYKQINGEYRTQVSVNGRKHGITKKSKKGASALLDVCRRNIFHVFKSLTVKQYEPITYQEAKLLNSAYYNFWLQIKKDILTGWTQKPEITLQFEG